MRTVTLAAVIAFALAGGWKAAAQDAAEPAFDAASVKVNTSGSPASNSSGRNGVYTATNVTLRQLIVIAYRIRDFQLDGAPDWTMNDRYDIVARAPAGSTASNSAMLQALLRDRFKLRVHTEVREQPVYALVMARSDRRFGPKLKQSTLDCTATPPAAGCGMNTLTGNDGGKMVAGGQTMARFAEALGGFGLGQMVVDRTGLTGMYDFELQWRPDNQRATPVQSDLPSIFTALQEQLGLKLDSSRGPVDFVVVESVSHPEPDEPPPTHGQRTRRSRHSLNKRGYEEDGITSGFRTTTHTMGTTSLSWRFGLPRPTLGSGRRCSRSLRR